MSNAVMRQSGSGGEQASRPCASGQRQRRHRLFTSIRVCPKVPLRILLLYMCPHTHAHPANGNGGMRSSTDLFTSIRVCPKVLLCILLLHMCTHTHTRPAHEHPRLPKGTTMHPTTHTTTIDVYAYDYIFVRILLLYVCAHIYSNTCLNLGIHLQFRSTNCTKGWGRH
jgi:hypothetical protein